MNERYTYKEYCELVKKLNKLGSRLNKNYNLKNTFYISSDIPKYGIISIYDLYYILKFYGFKINSDVNLKMTQKIMLRRYIDSNTLDKLKKLDIVEDDRILIIPPEIVFHPLMKYSFYPTLLSIDELNINENTKAINLNNYGQAVAISRALKNNKAAIDYLLVNRYLYDSISSVKHNDDILEKMMIIPDNISYNELPAFLDENIYNNEAKIKRLN